MRFLIALVWMLIPLEGFALNVVATTSDLAAIAREVGGPDVTVHAIASSSQDPHYVDAKPSIALALNKADLLLVNGVELEVGWLPSLIKTARNAKVLPGAPGYFDASTSVRLLEVVAKTDRAKGDIHPGGNPHFLHDPRAAADVAVALGTRMASVDPTHAQAYQLRALAFAQSARAKADAWRAKFEALKHRKVVAYHGSLPYLFDWLGLELLVTVEPKPGVQPNPGHVAKVLQLMRQSRVSVVVQETYYPSKTSSTLAQMAKGTVVVIPGGTTEQQTYLERVDATAGGIYEALAR